MVFLNYKEVPWFWHGFDQFWFAAIMSCWCRVCWPWRWAGSPSEGPGTGRLSLDHTQR